MLQCQHSDLGYLCPSRPSTGRAKVTLSTSRFLSTLTGQRCQDKFEKGFVADRRTNQNNQSHEIWVSKSLENERATFQASDIESNLRWTPDQINASSCLQ